MNNSRSKRAMYNSVTALLLQFVSLICGLIVPRLILSNFGSAYNGIISSITHFISAVTLMKAGLGGVTRAALYKPLAENDYTTVSEILYEAEKYIRKVAVIFICGVVVFAAIFPVWTADDFSWFFTFSLIVIVSITTFLNYFFCYTRSVLLEADQKIGIWSLAEISTTILNTIFTVILIKLGATIHVVKLGSAIAFLASPIIVYGYTNRHYVIDKNARPKTSRITQRWDALSHEIAGFINENIDVITITIFLNVKEVSVYTVYAYVTTSIRKIVLDFVSGFNAAFGNMYAKHEYELMSENLKIYELVLFSITTIIYSVTLTMITPFVLLYTTGVKDVNYHRELFGVLLTLANAFTCFRIPYNTITLAVGHFKQTKKYTYCEAILNVVISSLAVMKWGIIGVTFGTLVAAVVRATMFAIYLSKNIVPRSIAHYIVHVFVSLCIMFLMYFLGNRIIPDVPNALLWIEKAIVMTVLASGFTFITDAIIWNKELMRFVQKVFAAIKNRKR